MNSNESKINLIISQFIKASIQQKKSYNPYKLSEHISSWAGNNPKLAISICRCLLKYPKAIAPEQESIIVEQLLNNCLKNEQIKSKKAEKRPSKDKTRLFKKTEKIDRSEQSTSFLLIKPQNKIKSLAQKREQRNTTKGFSTANARNDTSPIGKRQAKAKWDRNLFLILFLLSLLASGFWFRKKIFANNITLNSKIHVNELCTNVKQRTNKKRKSLGEKNLILNSPNFSQIKFTKAVIKGMNAFADCKFDLAAQSYKQALDLDKNNPEIVIYLNNALAATSPNLRIAVSVPIGTKREVAEEILRGVAQAQTEINQEGGINRKLLSVEINDDDNDSETVRKIAAELVQQPDILAVLGHNDSNASLAAAPIYQQGGLVMISPTSTASGLSEVGDYIFRTVHSVTALANSLANYTFKSARKTSIAFCHDTSSAVSQSFFKEFREAIVKDGGRLIDINCDFNATNFDPQKIFENLKPPAEALILLPSVESISEAIAVTRANQDRLQLLGTHSLYTFETIKEGQAGIEDMVLAVPWQSGFVPNSSFAQATKRIWGGDVNWRTAMAYDATLAIIQGLRKSATREELQGALSDRRFAVNGATGKFAFENGDRKGEVLLVKIQKLQNSSENNYKFVPLEADD